MHQIS